MYKVIWYSYYVIDFFEVLMLFFYWVEDMGKLLVECYFILFVVEKDGVIYEGSKKILCFVEVCYWIFVCKFGFRLCDYFILLYVYVFFVFFKILRKIVM